MRKVPTLGLIVVGAALAVSASAQPQPAVAGDTKLQRALDELVAAGAPGAVALVRDGDRTIRLTSVKGAKTLMGLDRGLCASPERIARWPCRSFTSRSCRC